MPVPPEDTASPMRQIQLQYQQWTKTYKRNRIESVQESRIYVKRAASLVPILEAFADLHPIIKAVVNSFKSIVTYEQDRPVNDARMTAILIVQADVMGTLFSIDGLQARSKKQGAGLNSPDVNEALSNILRRVHKEIRSCGNSADTYYNKNLRMLQAWKAPEWKERMLKHSNQFVRYLVELETILLILPPSNAADLNKKFDALYKHLFSPKEAWEKNLINTAHQLKKSNNPQELIDDPETLRKLLRTTEDPGLDADELSGTDDDGGFKSALPTQIEQLKEELKLSLDVLCKRNEDTFLLKLDFHTQQLKESISKSAAYVVKSLSGPYDRLHHPDLKVLWKEMNWIFCVDNSHFTSALFEYYLDHFSTARVRPNPNADIPGDPNKDEKQQANDTEDPAQANLSKVTFLSRMGVLNHPDTWALESIAMYGDRISNSIDRDDSGFIRISEINSFTDKMPKGWTMPQWCAYAAIGWVYEARLYRKRIHHLIGKMFEMQARVLPNNRGFLALQVFHEVAPFFQLLAWEPTNVDNPDPPDELRSLVHQKVKSQDEEWRAKLSEKLKWTVADETTLKLLFEKQPLETYLLQLSVLLLEHTYQVMQVGMKSTIDSKEVQHLLAPLTLLQRLSLRRIQGLKEQFAKEKKDSDYIGTYYGGIWYSFDCWETHDFLPFDSSDIIDFGRDESLIKDSAGELASGVLPYLKYTTWEDHIQHLPTHKIPRQIPDTWNAEPHHGPQANNDVSSTRNETAGFPMAFYSCRRCQRESMSDFHYMCILCDDFFLCSECYHASLNGDTPTPHQSKHPVLRFALHTVEVHRKWMALDAEIQLQQIRVSLVSQVLVIGQILGIDSDDESETANESDDGYDDGQEEEENRNTLNLEEGSDGGEDDGDSDHDVNSYAAEESDDDDDDDYFDGGAFPEDIIPAELCDHCHEKIDIFDDDTTFYKCFRHCCTNFWLCENCANQHITSEEPNGHQWWHSLIVVRPGLLVEEEIASATQSQAEALVPPSAIESRLSAVEAKLDTTNSTLKTTNATLEERMTKLEGKVDTMFAELRTFIATFPRDAGEQHTPAKSNQPPAGNVAQRSMASNKPPAHSVGQRVGQGDHYVAQPNTEYDDDENEPESDNDNCVVQNEHPAYAHNSGRYTREVEESFPPRAAQRNTEDDDEDEDDEQERDNDNDDEGQGSGYARNEERDYDEDD